MTLKEWLDERGTPLSWFARKVGISRQALVPIQNGTGRPTPENADLISEATEGAVTVKELLYPIGLSEGASWE